jgi:hypothetical protein
MQRQPCEGEKFNLLILGILECHRTGLLLPE